MNNNIISERNDDTINLLSNHSYYLQGPALILFLISIGSSIFCTVVASQKNRNTWIWLWKGFLGGPFTIQSLQNVPTLITQLEQKNQNQTQ
jgi:hypothetical protein